MATKGVRVVPQPRTAPQLRRRPVQSRARASSQALQDAFVRVWLELGYEKTTVREVVAVAGVGVGTFYEYFGNMQALAALCVHQHVKRLAQQARAAARASAGQPLVQLVHRQITSQLDAVLCDAPLWAALFALERQVTTPEAFRRPYEAWVALWRSTLASAQDPPKNLDAAARMLHTMTYGSTSQALLACGAEQLDAASLRTELLRAALAYVAQLPRAD